MFKSSSCKMILNLKIYYFSGVLLLSSIGGLLGITFEEIVLFSCDICEPRNTKCCIGTIIYKNLVLTTTHCAKYCQFIIKRNKKIPIIKKYAKSNKRSYVYPLRSDIALVYVIVNLQVSKGVKLSALETASMIGLKASYPVLDKNKPEMRSTIINRCKKKNRLYGYNICSENAEKASNNCILQGVPLLLNNRIIGILVATNSKFCGQEQSVFAAIGPIINWINSIVELIDNLGNQKRNLRTSGHFINKMSNFRVFQTNSREELVSSLSFALRTPGEETATSSVMLSTIRSKTTKASTTPTRIISMSTTTTSKSTTISSTSTTTTTTTTMPTIPTPISALSTTVATLPAAVATLPAAISTLPTTISSKTTTVSTTAAISDLSLEGKPVVDEIEKEGEKRMNVMDWFNSNVRNKIKKPIYLILSTAENSFVDLT